MKVTRTLVLLLALPIVALTAACADAKQQAASAAATVNENLASAAADGGAIDTAIAEARRKLDTENLRLTREGNGPDAEITPTGDLLIGGESIALDAGQREATLAFRRAVHAVAESGMAMGKEGVEFAGQAISAVVAGLIAGGADAASANVEAEAGRMAAAGLALCDQVKGLQAAQLRLKTVVPEFAPYANDIDVKADCEGAAREFAPTAPTADDTRTERT